MRRHRRQVADRPPAHVANVAAAHGGPFDGARTVAEGGVSSARAMQHDRFSSWQEIGGRQSVEADEAAAGEVGVGDGG